jgi:hypothetical protein
MSSLPTAGFRTKTIVQALRGRTFACTLPECGRTDVSFDDARVPDKLNLYLKARGGEVNELFPLNASELADDVRCFRHPLAEVHMVPIRIIAEEMDAWVAKNAAAMQPQEPKQVRVRPIPPRQRVESPIRAVLFSRQPVVDKPGPQRRRHIRAPKVKRPTDAPKNYGTPEPVAEKTPQKAKRGQDARKHKKK